MSKLEQEALRVKLYLILGPDVYDINESCNLYRTISEARVFETDLKFKISVAFVFMSMHLWLPVQ
jgi:hypothetical protein